MWQYFTDHPVLVCLVVLAVGFAIVGVWEATEPEEGEG